MSIKGRFILVCVIIGILFIVLITWLFGEIGFFVSTLISVIIIVALSFLIGDSFDTSELSYSKKSNSIHSKVVGVTYNNDDGSDRQNYIKQDCQVNDELELIPYFYKGSPAIEVLSKFGNQIGNIKADLAKDIYDDVLNENVKCKITEVTGGVQSAPTHGVNIILLFTEDEVAEKQETIEVEPIEKAEAPIKESEEIEKDPVSDELSNFSNEEKIEKDMKKKSSNPAIIILIIGIACLLLAVIWYFAK